MGMRIVNLSDNYVQLTIDFRYWEQPETFYDSNNLDEAIHYFNLEIDSFGKLKRKVDSSESIVKQLGLKENQFVDFLEQLNTLSRLMSKQDALNYYLILPLWRPGKDYKVGDKILYNNLPFECIKDHTAFISVNPDEYWDLIELDHKIEQWYPDNNYASDDLVSYDEKIWKSLVDGNNSSPKDSNSWREISIGQD